MFVENYMVQIVLTTFDTGGLRPDVTMSIRDCISGSADFINSSRMLHIAFQSIIQVQQAASNVSNHITDADTERM